MSYAPRQQAPLSASAYFDDQNVRYRLCCCHVRIWATVIYILEMIGCVLHLVGAPIRYADLPNEAQHASGEINALVGGIIGSIITIIILILMRYGVKKEKRLFLIPYMVLKVLTIIILLLGAALLLIFMTVYGTTTSDRDKQVVPGDTSIEMSVAFLICALIEAFFLFVIIRCYRYLADKALAKETATHVPMATTYSTVEKAI